MLTLQQFEESITGSQPFKDLPVYLQALWYDARGDWDKAHHLVDHLSDKTACAIHAYLHRVERDHWNANYWYNKAGKTMPVITLKEEWKQLVQSLLEHI